MVFDPPGRHFAAAEGEPVHRDTAPAVGGGGSGDLPARQVLDHARVGKRQFLAVGALGTECREEVVFGHKAALLHTAHKDACAQNMQTRLREGCRQQHTAAMDHGGTVCEGRKILLGERVPGREALGGRHALPCPGAFAAAAALHRIPEGAGVLPAGCTGIAALRAGRLALTGLLLPVLLSGSRQPELLFGGITARCGQSTGSARLDQPGNEMALAALTGPDATHFAHIQRQTAGAVGLARAAKGVVHVAKHIRQRKFRVPGQERGHLPFILFGGKGAGGVDHLPTRREDGGSVVQDLRTQRGALLHQRFAVLGDGHRLLAEHPLAGTGRIHQDTVEELRQGRCDAGRRLV